MATLESRIEALETKHGDELLVRMRFEGETDQEALKRLGLANQSRRVIFMDESDFLS